MDNIKEAVVPEATMAAVEDVVENATEAKNVVKAAVAEAVKPSTEKEESSKTCACELSPELKDLVYWRCPKKTGAVVASGLIVFYLLFVGPYTLMTLFSFLALTAITFSMIYVNGTKMLAKFQGNNPVNPLQKFMDQEIAISADSIKSAVDGSVNAANKAIVEIKSVVLVEDNMKSAKVVGALYVIAMVGKLLSLPSIFFLIFASVFSVPKVYEMHQVQIDAQLDCAKALIKDYYGKALSKVQANMPAFMKAKTE
eukprot:Nk52_evm57s745 gene=Nk52_evmTU57s745